MTSRSPRKLRRRRSRVLLRTDASCALAAGARSASRGSSGALGSALYHDRVGVTVPAVGRRAVNTPQFDWARNKMGVKAQPVAPIFQPEVPARAIYFGAFNPRRNIWVGFPTVKAILANRIAPGVGGGPVGIRSRARRSTSRAKSAHDQGASP